MLSVFGDAIDNTIVASRGAAGNILINGGAVTIIGDRPTVANTDLIQMFGQGGNDTIRVDETNGAMPAAQLFGGDGNDTLTGGSGNDLLFGGAEPVLLAVASSIDINVNALAEAGISEVLPWPLATTELASALERCLQSHDKLQS